MNYKKTYFDYFKFGEQDVILCENCGSIAVDIHHVIFKSQGGTNDITNLMALCRDCHTKAHNNKEFSGQLKVKLEKRNLLEFGT